MKKAYYFFLFFILVCAGSLTGRFIRVYTDYKDNPWKYTPPYNTWLEELKWDFIIDGAAIIICVIAVVVLRKEIKKQGQKGA